MNRVSVLFLSAALTLAACDDDSSNTTPGGGPSADAGGDPQSYADGLPGRPATGEWIQIDPGGDTVCSRGDGFRFFARGGDPDKLIVYFEGGGACWDELTCGFADALFSDSIVTLEQIQALTADGRLGGFFDGTPGRQFSDYSLVYVPYCTGDIHWGNATKQYTDELTIEHRGYVNARAALDWAYSRYAGPQEIMVSGCSAGAYGAALHAAYIADHYQDANIAVLADSGAGIITETFLADSLPNWNAEEAIPDFIPTLDRPLVEMTLADLYIEVGKAFPEMRMAQTGAAFDADQIFFFNAMGGEPEDWPQRYRDRLDAIAAELPNFRYYVPPGSVHCVTPYTYFHERSVGGVAIADWTRDFVEAEALPDSVACEGAECCDDPVCDACQAAPEDDRGPWCGFCNNWPPPWSECAGE